MPSILMFLLGGITIVSVLNLVISGMPSILKGSSMYPDCIYVLNLVISGMPSILIKLFFQHLLLKF